MIQTYIRYYYFVLIVLIIGTLLFYITSCYDNTFLFKIPDSYLDIFINNFGSFSQIFLLSIVTFGFWGYLLVSINLLILCYNIASLINIYGITFIFVLLPHGLIEIMTNVGLLVICTRYINLIKSIYSEKQINKKVCNLVKNDSVFFLKVIIVVLFFTFISSIIEKTISPIVFKILFGREL